MTSVMGCADLTLRRTSIPSVSPMRRSVITTSYAPVAPDSAPCAPSAASSTSKPFPRSIIARVVRMLRWSSTTRILPIAYDSVLYSFAYTDVAPTWRGQPAWTRVRLLDSLAPYRKASKLRESDPWSGRPKLRDKNHQLRTATPPECVTTRLWPQVQPPISTLRLERRTPISCSDGRGNRRGDEPRFPLWSFFTETSGCCRKGPAGDNASVPPRDTWYCSEAPKYSPCSCCCPPPHSRCECLLLPNPRSPSLRADGRSGTGPGARGRGGGGSERTRTRH